MKAAIGLVFPGNLQDESVICSLCKEFDIKLNIIEASFSMASGWAFLEVEGDKAEIQKAFDFLVIRGIKIQNIETRK